MAQRIRRTNREIFMDKLTELSGESGEFVGNKTLRETLDWDHDRYDRVREEVFHAGLIARARGRGGSLKPVRKLKQEGLKVFVCYSHVDEELKNQLITHLQPLRQLKKIEYWHDGKIQAGDTWENAITKNLETADLVLLLVSSDFIASRYCFDVELQNAMDRHARKEATVIPVILRSCLWHRTPFAKLQAVPKDARPVREWENIDKALTDAAQSISDKVNDILESKQNS
jgi:hypothetical protein